ncbi:MAG TPA: NHL repeat-containing protein [Thermoanaerobaculia bacterium]|nr:NHL repeat-containing protein [Thermoanaerobaculia bacterium]
MAAILLTVTAEGASPMRIDTVAGNPADANHRDGNAQVAAFSHPTGVVADTIGNIYVADSGNHVIRMLTPTAEVRTLAGEPGAPGGSDGQGSAARFRNPTGIALDRTGDLLVADSGNCTIRRISPSGFVTTVAGTAGICGFDEGDGGRAQFAHPTGLAVDLNGDIFVADRANHLIRRIRDGLVTTYAGTPLEVGSRDGRGIGARFYLPFGIAIDALGDLYVADSGNHLIRKITKDREVTTICGIPETFGTNDGECSVARMNRPSGIAIQPNGSLLIADSNNHTIRRVSVDGRMETLAGLASMNGFMDGVQNNARMYYPFGITSGPDGSVWVVELINHALRRGTEVESVVRRRPALRR